MRKVLLVDDHHLIFVGLSSSVKLYELEYASSNEAALSMMNETNYYAVILDLSIGKDKGFDIISKIPRGCYVYVLSMHKTPLYIQMARNLGANGYFLKDESPELLLEALSRPLERSFWMSEAVEGELKRAKSYEGSYYEKLSPREQQIFAMLAEDQSYIDIAKRLGLSKKTVNNHRDHIMKKMVLTSQIALVREAIRLGVVNLKE